MKTPKFALKPIAIILMLNFIVLTTMCALLYYSALDSKLQFYACPAGVENINGESVEVYARECMEQVALFHKDGKITQLSPHLLTGELRCLIYRKGDFESRVRLPPTEQLQAVYKKYVVIDTDLRRRQKSRLQ